MKIELNKKVAMVTGGTRGIGFACAELLAASGARVVVVGRQPKNIEKATTLIRKKGEAKGYQLDVTNFSTIGPTVERIRKEMGEIDILVCSAGVDLTKPTPAKDITEAEWDHILTANAKGLFFTNQTVAVQSMIPRKTGAIVNVSSQVGLVGAPMCIAYCTSKAAVAQITRAEALEWAAFNIRVNAIAPGWTFTDMSNTLFNKNPGMMEHELTKIPLNRIATIEEIAPAAVFLASDFASMITGTIFPIDGGWTCQ